MEKGKIIRSLAYKFTERFAVKGIGLVISIVLGRLLAPDLFGQLALVTVFTDISLTLVEGGLNTALVQAREADDRDYSTVFYITCALSLVMIAEKERNQYSTETIIAAADMPYRSASRVTGLSLSTNSTVTPLC